MSGAAGFSRQPKAIAKAEAVRGNAARLASTPTLCLCKRPDTRGLAARMLLVRSESLAEAEADSCIPKEGKSAARDLTRPRSARLARVGGTVRRRVRRLWRRPGVSRPGSDLRQADQCRGKPPVRVTAPKQAHGLSVPGSRVSGAAWPRPGGSSRDLPRWCLGRSDRCLRAPPGSVCPSLPSAAAPHTRAPREPG
jgi:hypothetical protein